MARKQVGRNTGRSGRINQTTGHMPRERDEKGRITESYPLDEVHATLEEIGPAGTREVSDALGSSYETAFKKLKALESDGRVTSRKVGNALLWSVDE